MNPEKDLADATGQGFPRASARQVVVYCGGNIAVKWEFAAKLAITLYCRAWTCPECAPVRHRQLVAQFMRGRPNTFITLTMRRRADLSADHAARIISKSWAALVKRVAREARRDVKANPLPFGAPPEGGWQLEGRAYIPRQANLIGGRLEYGAVFERHKSGFPHLHVLARAQWIDQAWLSLQWADLTGSPVVHITRATGQKHTVGYVAKYVGKEPARIGKSKRYWFSRGWQIEPKPERRSHCDFGGKWELEQSNLALWIERQEVLGWRVERIDHRTAISRAPP